MSSTAAERTAELQAELARLQRLPPRSAYATHRRACVERALALLAAPRNATEEDELTRLLSGLCM